jgi:hypothetical protein
MHRPIVILLALLLAAGTSAQERAGDAPPSFRDRIWFGGGVGLSFGTFTAIQLDPMVGYKVDKPGKLSLGVGGSYWYFRDNRFSIPYEFNAYGYRIFSRYRFIEQAFAHVEWLHMNVETRRFGPLSDIGRRAWVPHLLVGGGYMQRLGGRSSVFLQVLFDVVQDPNSLYYGVGPIFGGGVAVGF